MTVHAHILGEFVALLKSVEHPEALSDDAVGVLLNEACKKYRFRPTKKLARRICERASKEIAVRRKAKG